jgi:hypothetical protein
MIMHNTHAALKNNCFDSVEACNMHKTTHMRFPIVPKLDHLSDYLNWQCIHVLSNRKYHDFVTEQSLLPDKVRPFAVLSYICRV